MIRSGTEALTFLASGKRIKEHRQVYRCKTPAGRLQQVRVQVDQIFTVGWWRQQASCSRSECRYRPNSHNRKVEALGRLQQARVQVDQIVTVQDGGGSRQAAAGKSAGRPNSHSQ
jgi:hypothetical protein